MIGLNTLVRILVSSVLTAMVSGAPDTVTTISLMNVLTQPNELVSAMMNADETEAFTEDGVAIASIDMISAIMQMQQADTVTEEVIEVAEVAEVAETAVVAEAVVFETQPVMANDIYLPAEISIETQITESFEEPAYAEVAQAEDDWIEVTEEWHEEVAAGAETAAAAQIPAAAPAQETEYTAPEYTEPEYTEPATEAPAQTWTEPEQETQAPVEIPEEEYVETEDDWYEPSDWYTQEDAPGWSGDVLTAAAGVVTGPNGRETYYNLDMSGVVSIMEGMGYDYEYWVRDDGVKMYGDYVMVAANLDTHPRGSIYETSLGYGIVCDTGSFAFDDPYQTDIAVNW